MASVSFPPAVGGDGSTVTDDANVDTGLRRGGYKTRFVPALSNTVNVANFVVTRANAAATSATAAATSAAEAKTSELAAATFANAAQQTTLGFDTNRPTIRPSLNLDFVNQQVVDRRIVVNRNSPKTYFGKEKVLGDENLVRYSEDFTNAVWEKANVNVSSNTQLAPDGTLTADTITDNNLLNNVFAVFQTTSGAANTKYYFSCYLKAGTAEAASVFIYSNAGNIDRVDVNLVNNTVVQVNDGAVHRLLSVGIEPASNGYFRVWGHYETGSTATISARVYIIDLADVGLAGLNGLLRNGTGSTTLNLWGAQLETAREGQTKPTAYVRTDAYPVRRFFNKLQTAPANTMPVEFDPITQECLGIKPESQATNLLTFSEQFDNAVWIKSASTIVTNSTVAPDGQITADTFVPGTANNVKHLGRLISLTGNSFVFSCYFKSAGYRYAYLFAVTSGPTQVAEGRFDLELGVSSFTLITGAAFTDHGTRIENVGNGWYRCTVFGTGNNPLASQFITCNPNAITNAPNAGFVGNGFSGVYMWGAQLEASTLGSPSSYVPTQNSSVTRLADDLSMPVSAFEYNQNEGSVYVEAQGLPPVDTTRSLNLFSLDSGDQNYWIVFRSDNQTGTPLQSTVSNQNILQVIDLDNIAIVSQGGFFRFSGSLKRNDYYASANGLQITSDLAVEPPFVTTLRVGRNFNGGSEINGYIRALRYYPKALSALEAQSLTQI